MVFLPIGCWAETTSKPVSGFLSRRVRQPRDNPGEKDANRKRPPRVGAGELHHGDEEGSAEPDQVSEQRSGAAASDLGAAAPVPRPALRDRAFAGAHRAPRHRHHGAWPTDHGDRLRPLGTRVLALGSPGAGAARLLEVLLPVVPGHGGRQGLLRHHDEGRMSPGGSPLRRAAAGHDGGGHPSPRHGHRSQPGQRAPRGPTLLLVRAAGQDGGGWQEHHDARALARQQDDLRHDPPLQPRDDADPGGGDRRGEPPVPAEGHPPHGGTRSAG